MALRKKTRVDSNRAATLREQPGDPDHDLGANLDALTHAVVNALHTIAAGSELATLLIARGETSGATEALARVESECMRAAHLLRAGREFMTFTVNPAQGTVDLAALVNACAESFDGRVKVARHRVLPAASGDAKALRRACMEILGNAFQFEAQQVHVTLKSVANGQRIRISFQDDGTGISQPVVRLCEPFFSTLKGEHCGLGLTLAARIVKAHGGGLGADSAARGATFWIELPTHAA